MNENMISKNKCSSGESSTKSEKRTYTVNEIQNILSIGRNTAYELIKSNVFKSVRIGGIIRISKCSFDKWLDEKSQVCD